jgi:hypothetical protein
MYDIELQKHSPLTNLAGITAYFTLLTKLKLFKKINSIFSCFHPTQGWDAASIIITIMVINLTGYSSVTDVHYLIADMGFVMMFRNFIKKQMTSSEYRNWKRRFNEKCNGTLPSPTVLRSFLDAFHLPEMVGKKGTAKIHDKSQYLNKVDTLFNVLVEEAYIKAGKPKLLTIDQDATISNTCKSTALYCYEKSKAYQPVNCYSPELDSTIASQFRDGNVPAKMGLMEMMKDTLVNLPEGVETVHIRSDSAAYNNDYIRSMCDGSSSDKHTLKFAISALMSKSIKKRYSMIKESNWSELDKQQDCVEVEHVDDKISVAHKLRLILIRTKISDTDIQVPATASTNQQLELGLDYPEDFMDSESIELEELGQRYKIRAILSNRESSIETKDLIYWARKRAGKSEGIHSVQKSDLAGGKFPSSKFGANAAWWMIMNLTIALQAIVSLLSLPKELKGKRFKELRAKVINTVAKISTAARGFVIILNNSLHYENVINIIKKIEAAFT